MVLNYFVKKRKANRIAYRILGCVFIMTAALQGLTLTKHITKHPMLTMTFAVLLGAYGLYLFSMSFRRQAFDITYKFSEEGMLVTHRYGETMYTFDDIEFITMVIPDDSLIYYLLNIKAKKDIYTIPFTNKREFCEKIYEFVNARIKHDDDDVIYLNQKNKSNDAEIDKSAEESDIDKTTETDTEDN